MKVDLNCDVGESYHSNSIGNDAALMPYITSCNIACGFHGGDPFTIQKTIQLAIKNNVSIGAHPSFPDLENFGRKFVKMAAEDLIACLEYQIAALKGMTELQGGTLAHVKPHGALYNAAATDYELAFLLAKTIQKIDEKLIFLGLGNSQMEKACLQLNVPFVKEFFGDRSYTDEGLLVSRTKSNALITNYNLLEKQVVKAVKEGKVISENNKEIFISAESICIHGDTENATDLVKNLHRSFIENGIEIKSFSK